MTPGRLLFTAAYLLFWPALMLSLAGDWLWLPAWIVGGWFVAVGASTMGWLARKDPGLLEERFRMPGTGGQSRRDQIMICLITVGFVAWIVLMPLDARRFHWTPRLPLAVGLVGDVCLALSWFFLFRAFADNPFGSALVRVQRERGHRVVTTGAYAWVRHPMYLGATLMFVGGPLVAGSLSALVVGLALVLLLAVRSLDEEALLTRELTGYEEYRRRVRYRLVPFLW
ncbi:MAG TPA: methyltransferase [Methylomirabilota bacterium]